MDPEPFSTRHIFKAKGEKHREVAQKKPAQNSIAAFVDLVVTVPRLEKAFVEAFGESEPSTKSSGWFIGKLKALLWS